MDNYTSELTQAAISPHISCTSWLSRGDSSLLFTLVGDPCQHMVSTTLIMRVSYICLIALACPLVTAFNPIGRTLSHFIHHHHDDGDSDSDAQAIELLPMAEPSASWSEHPALRPYDPAALPEPQTGPCDRQHAPIYEGLEQEEKPGNWVDSGAWREMDISDFRVRRQLNRRYTPDWNPGEAMCPLGQCHWQKNSKYELMIPEGYMCCRSRTGHYYCRVPVFEPSPELELPLLEVDPPNQEEIADNSADLKKFIHDALSEGDDTFSTRRRPSLGRANLDRQKMQAKADKHPKGKEKAAQRLPSGEFYLSSDSKGCLNYKVDRLPVKLPPRLDAGYYEFRESGLRVGPCYRRNMGLTRCSSIPKGYQCCGWGEGIYCKDSLLDWRKKPITPFVPYSKFSKLSSSSSENAPRSKLTLGSLPHLSYYAKGLSVAELGLENSLAY